jgi:hypothetical protein
LLSKSSLAVVPSLLFAEHDNICICFRSAQQIIMLPLPLLTSTKAEVIGNKSHHDITAMTRITIVMLSPSFPLIAISSTNNNNKHIIMIGIYFM